MEHINAALIESFDGKMGHSPTSAVQAAAP